VTDFERETYRDMDGVDRCLPWLIKIHELFEYSKCLTVEDLRKLKQAFGVREDKS